MIDEQVYNAVGRSLTVAPRVYAAVPGVSKWDVDEALWRLYLAKRVYLEEHTSPHHKERDRMIHAGGKVFVGASKRNPSERLKGTRDVGQRLAGDQSNFIDTLMARGFSREEANRIFYG